MLTGVTAVYRNIPNLEIPFWLDKICLKRIREHWKIILKKPE